jgi:hypothetical protein
VDTSAGGKKAVEIRGAGSVPTTCTSAMSLTGECGSAGQTIIYMNSTTNAFGWLATPSSHSMTIDNIKFVVDQNSAFAIYGIITTAQAGSTSPYIIHHNDFIFVGNTSGNCRGYGIMAASNSGVIYRNRFTAQPVPACGNGNTNTNALVLATDETGWAAASTFGSGDTNGVNVYFENNYMEDFNVAVDVGNAARIVWRFNEMHNATISGHGFDSGLGPRGVEYYNNINYCDQAFGNSFSFFARGGTGFVFNNTFPAVSPSFCGITPTASPIFFNQFNLIECDYIAGWPGSYPASYPISHQVGWGWISGSNQTVGDSSRQNMPGLNGYPVDGYQQALEPWYLFNNANMSGNPLTYIGSGYASTCRAMSYSNSSKASGMTLTIPGTTPNGYPKPYANVGQQLLAVLADNVGGSTPTISSSPSCTWTALSAGTNGGTRLSAWTCMAVTDGQYTITFNHDSSSAARAGTVLVMRGLTASPSDVNPAVTTINASPYNASPTGTLNSQNEIVIGYYALATPSTDNIQPGGSDAKPVSCYPACGNLIYSGINGTTGGSDVSVATTYRVVNATTSIQVQVTDSTANPNGLAGVVSFKVNGSTAALQTGTTPLDLKPTDFIQFDREVYDDKAGSFNGTSGTGSGPRSSRPSTCTTGVAWWSTDQGNWNGSGSGGQGVLDKCTATNTWTNAWYVPYPYPHPLTLTAPAAPMITNQPSSQTIGSGSTTTLSVVATGSLPLSYQWYQGLSGDTSTPLGTNSGTFTTPALTTTTNYWVSVTNSVSSASSTTATITVIAAVAPAITTPPASQTIASGATASLSVVASGTAPLNYQWYQGTSGTTTTPVGTNSSSFTTPALATTTSYWVEATNSAGSVNSNTATITVTVGAPSITTQPVSQTIGVGATASLSVVASGTAPFTYQWYQGSSGTTTTPVGTNSSSFTTPALTTTTSYWVQVTNSAGSVNSNTATITTTVSGSFAPAITTQPLSQAIASGSTATLSVLAGGTAPLTYHWYQGTSGTTTTPVGTNSNSFTTPPLTTATSYWVQVTNIAGSVNSVTATVGIKSGTNTPPVISMATPLNGSTVSGTITVSAFPTSSVGIASVQFQLDNANLGPAVITGSPSSLYSIRWVLTTTTNGTHTLSAIATDLNGNQGISTPISVTVSNVVPTELYNIPPNGGISISTATDSNTTTQVSHALIQQDAATSVSAMAGVAIIGFRTNGVLVSEAGIPAAPQIMSGRVYTEISNTANTAIALSNLTGTDATVTFYFTDKTGMDFGSGSMTLSANHQFAFFLNQPPFNGPASFQGSFTFSSTVPIDAIAIRGLVNERSEFLFTTVPVAPVGVSPGANVLPEFVNGAGWTTSLFLTNASSDVETGTIQFFGQGSGSANAPLLNMTVNGVFGTSFNYSIPAHSAARFDTSGGTSIQVGSIQVTPVSNDVPSAVSLFQLRENGITISETSVIAAPVSTGFQMYMEASGVNGKAGSIQSGLAVANPSSSPAVVFLDLNRLDGTPAGLGTATVNIPPGGQISTFINQLFPEMPASFQGTANLTSATPVAAVALRGRYNERDDFLMTTTPPLNVLSSSPGALVFPEIDSGQGWGTQIIVFGTNGGTGRLYLMTSTGVSEPSSTLH